MTTRRLVSMLMCLMTAACLFAGTANVQGQATQDASAVLPDRGRELMREGYRFESKAVMQQSARVLRRAVENNPLDPTLRKDLGYLYLDGLKQYGKAADQFEALVILDPDDPENVWMLADALQKDGQHSRASYYYWRYGQYYPTSLWAQYRQGRTSNKSWFFGDSYDAYYNGAFGPGPGTDGMVYARAWTHAWWGNRSVSDAMADEMLAVNDDDPNALTLKGDTAAVDRDFDRAMHYYGQALEANPGDKAALAGLDAIERKRRAKVNVSYYNFVENSTFAQSSIFSSALVPVTDKFDVIPYLNYRWFSQDNRTNTERLEAGVDGVYHFNRYFTLYGGVNQFLTDDRNPVAGFNVGGYVSPFTVFGVHAYYRENVPMSTSITSVASRYTEDMVGGDMRLDLSPDMWVYLEGYNSEISDGNDRYFVMPQLGIRLWEYPDIVLKNQLEIIRYDHTTPDYPSPTNYDTYRLLLEVDVPVCKGFGVWSRYEMPVLLKNGSVGFCLTVGPYFRPTKTTLLSVNYLYCYYPDDDFNWSGQGLKASFTVEF